MSTWVPLDAAAITAAGSAAKGAPAAPSGVFSDPYTTQSLGLGIDFSGWTVATGQGRAMAERTQETADIVPDWLKLAAIGLAAVVAVRWIARKSQ